MFSFVLVLDPALGLNFVLSIEYRHEGEGHLADNQSAHGYQLAQRHAAPGAGIVEVGQGRPCLVLPDGNRQDVSLCALSDSRAQISHATVASRGDGPVP